MLQERVPQKPVASLSSYMRLHTTHDGQALQAAVPVAQSPTENTQKHAPRITGESGVQFLWWLLVYLPRVHEGHCAGAVLDWDKV